MSIHRLITLSVMTALVAGVGMAVRAQRPDASPAPSVEERQRQGFRAGGLRAAAAVTGTYVTRGAHDELGSPSSLKALASSVQTIVVGRVKWNFCHVTRDGFSIFTRYEVEVERSLKGNVPAGETIALVVPGGRFRFEDGTWAQVNIDDFLRPENDGQYALFLRQAEPGLHGIDASSASTFRPAFGALGIYPLNTRKGFVYASGNNRSPLGRSVAAQRFQPDAFLTYLEGLLR